MLDLQGGPKNWHHFLYALTSSNINRFFQNSFTVMNQAKISNSTMYVCIYVFLLYRPKAIHCNYQLSITAVFVEYLRQFLIDLNQIYRHSMIVVCQKHVSVNFLSFLIQAVSEHGAAATFSFCRVVLVTV